MEEDSKPAALPTEPSHHPDHRYPADGEGISPAAPADPSVSQDDPVVPDGAVSSAAFFECDADEMRRRQERRRKRKRLKNHMQNQGSNPLFTDFLSSEFDMPHNDEVIVIHDDDDDADHSVVIDVDVQLGLKEAPLSPSVSSAALQDNDDATNETEPRIHTRSTKKISKAAAASAHFSIHTENQENSSALDEGWYEGLVSPIAMPEDASYLNAVHCFVRQHVEFFSCPGGTRRKRGRVGMRCVHCAAQAADDPAFSWPTGALSYPNSFASVHQACAQRFQVHWQSTCAFMPAEVRTQFQLLVQESQHAGRPTKRSRGGIPAPTYYTLSMQRMGLVETSDGLRFSRDLKLEPLPLETVRATLEAQTVNVDDSHGSMEAATTGNKPAQVSSASDAAMKEARGTIDESAERVLAECIAEADQPEKHLARGSDKALVTDYIFITIRQMALCHALPEDMSSRGKKTKLMQVGFAGFCCRFCQNAAGGTSVAFMPGSCRSFLSAADNLGSAITNSFTQHLLKCRYAPQSIQKALGVFKRIHQRQMGLLPYGAQRRFFHLLWDRLRDADKSREEIEALLPPKNESPPNGSLVASENQNGMVDSAGKLEASEPNGYHPTPFEALPAERPVNFPESNDEVTRRVLEEATAVFAERKVGAAKYLLLPEERNLVSDYVFLTLMQLTPVAPTAADHGRSRRPLLGGVMGVACIHCLESDRMATPSGRSFPSAPDNFASALNTSLYNHMQACGSVPPEIKRAFVNLRKLHSAQCSSLVFGSQRKYFNLLFSRLRQLYSETDASGSEVPLFEPRETLATLGFLKMTNPSGQVIHMCKRCRMVPVAFRARDAVCYDRLSLSRARVHRSICREDGLDLTFALDSFVIASAALGQSPLDLLQDAAFQKFVSASVGGEEELKNVFIEQFAVMLRRQAEANGDNLESLKDTSDIIHRGLWKNFPRDVSFEDVDSAYREMASSFGLESKLQESTALLDYLMLISPALLIPDDIPPNTTNVAEAEPVNMPYETAEAKDGREMNGDHEEQHTSYYLGGSLEQH